MDLENTVLYGSYFQMSQIHKYSCTPIRLKIFTTPSILLPGDEPHKSRIHSIMDAHRNIIFFDAENLNVLLIFQYVNLCRETEDLCIILVPIISPDVQPLCNNNIRQIKSSFPEIKMC